MAQADPDREFGIATGWARFLAEEQARGTDANALWHQILAEGLPFLLERQAESAPAPPGAACVYCFRPFGREVRRNRLNRYYCDDCDTFIRTTPGQAEIVAPCVAVDVRNATAIEQSLGPRWVPLIHRFRTDVGCAIQRHHGFVMSSAGASVLAVFPPGFLPIAKRGSTNVAAEAVEVAETLAKESPKAFVGDRLPYGVGVHTGAVLLFSVRGDPDDGVLSAEEGEFDPQWRPATEDIHDPVSIDAAGEAVFVAAELSGMAGGGEALITRTADGAAGCVHADTAYQETRTKASTVAVRSRRPAGDALPPGAQAIRETPVEPGGSGESYRSESEPPVRVSSIERLGRFVRLNTALKGRYHVEHELGEGGMAVVYLADDLKHDRKVALKVLKSEVSRNIGAQRFVAEIKTTAHLQHPHILPLFDSGEADGYLYYVMPHVSGESLRGRLEAQGRLPVDEAVRIASAVARALDYAHRHGVVHRDIKPANILMQDGEAVVADFGIALAATAAPESRLTQTGFLMGTLAYMSPEQVSDEGGMGPASDIYSLGCVLYEMLGGEPPFTGSRTAMVAKILTQRPLGLRQLRDTVPVHVEATVEWALAKAAQDRPPSAGAFVHALSTPSSS